MSFQQQIEDLKSRALAALDGEVGSIPGLQHWERTFLSGKGELANLMRGLGAVPADQRPEAGRAANAAKQELANAFEARKSALAAEQTALRLANESVDVTLPGRKRVIGSAHPVSQMIDEMSEIFALMGFQTVFGPEVETAHYNFDLLNIPSDHPARDVWDTIHVDLPGEIVLRTHTSPMQARIMEQTTPPVRVVVPGRVYRYEAQDASHEWMFHQL